MAREEVTKEVVPAPTPAPFAQKSKQQLYDEKPTVGRFRVLVGKHSEGGKIYGKGTPNGDIVDSKSDLEKLNTAAGKKFERIGKKRPTPASQVAAKGEEESYEDEGESNDGLEDMTVEELKEVAETEEVEYASGSRKADIIAAIRESRSK